MRPRKRRKQGPGCCLLSIDLYFPPKLFGIELWGPRDDVKYGDCPVRHSGSCRGDVLYLKIYFNFQIEMDTLSCRGTMVGRCY